MNERELISAVKEIVAHRIEGEPTVSGKWLVWGCRKSPQTMSKFVNRVRKVTGHPAFCRDGKFGVVIDARQL